MGGNKPLTKVLEKPQGRPAKFPLTCWYQGCHNLIEDYPFVRRIGSSQRHTKYYHVECATLLRVI